MRLAREPPASRGRRYRSPFAPEGIKILVGSINGSRSLCPLGVQELHDPCPFLAACLPGPQLYVKEHLVPALYLPFQLGLQSMPLAQ